MREQAFFGLKLLGVYAAAASAQLYRMLQVKHLIIHKVFDREAGNPRMVENPAYDDSVVRRIVVA